MFPRLFFTALCLLAATAASAAELTIVHVYTGWRDAASFKRISEYFDGKENPGNEKILRTQPDQRGGYYFLIRIANTGSPRSAQAHLEIIDNTTAKPVTHVFALDLGAGKSVIQLGLTGKDWPDAKANPVAWKLNLTDEAGQVLASAKSYLWEKPAAN